MNRLDEIVLFKPLTLPEIERIVDLMFNDLLARLAHRQMTLEICQEARRYIAQQGFDPVYGASRLGRQTRAVAEKVRVLERGTDLVLAEHRTPIRGRLVATTVETVKFHRPDRVSFRLVRGPVPHVTEEFLLDDHDG